MSPTEYIMQALAGCYTATLTMMAAEKGIDLDGIELDLNFDINLNGFLGLDSNVRKGAKSIRVDVHLDEQDRQSRGVRSAGQRNAKEFANPRYSG